MVCQKSQFSLKIKLLDKNKNLGEQEFFSKIKIFVKNQNFRQKSKFSSKKQNFRHKSKFSSNVAEKVNMIIKNKNLVKNFAQKSKFCSKTEILMKIFAKN